MAIGIVYNAATIGFAADNGGILNGENQGFGWISPVNQNNMQYAVGFLVSSPANVNIIFDQDAADNVIIEPDIQGGTIGQTV
ncbi:hypothetical protein JOD45_002771 [Scopulibacillus daqui]|uniref:Spore germination protein GerPA/GerPF n=1 Tax=Scopulibacillus daqui TaxID=1469162 RepID=A0ABS2Q2U9_9BACL|nr:hypothetical protein [Scopulibacillus daqui]MBM7646541.1 hypothetical protein [Scopulibacillus daqui]